MPAADGPRTVLTAKLLHMKHSVESVRDRLGCNVEHESQQSSMLLDPSPEHEGHHVPSMPMSAIGAMHHPRLQHHDQARPDRTPPLRRRTAVVATGRAPHVFTRPYEEFSESYTPLHELHAGTYGTVHCYQHKRVCTYGPFSFPRKILSYANILPLPKTCPLHRSRARHE